MDENIILKIFSDITTFPQVKSSAIMSCAELLVSKTRNQTTIVVVNSDSVGNDQKVT
jgi:hypothetical protein